MVARDIKSCQPVVVVREEYDNLGSAFRTAREQLPGLLPSTLPRQVVIKPNLCDIAGWETGVTTDPQWVGVLARELREIRSDVEIRIVESDATSAYKMYRSCDETFERLGYAEAAREAGVELVNLSRKGTLEIRLDGVPFPVRIPELFLEEIYFISLANLKVHGYTRMTGVLKNALGLLTDADISALHPYLTNLIGGLYRLFPPDLCIIDGRIGLEGHGPIVGLPLRMNTILVGRDALAVDETACRLMGVPPKEVPYIRRVAKNLGRSLGEFEPIGEMRPRTFAFAGERTHRAILMKFGSRRLHHRMDAFTGRWIDRAVRFRQDPIAFAKAAASKLTRSVRGR